MFETHSLGGTTWTSSCLQSAKIPSSRASNHIFRTSCANFAELNRRIVSYHKVHQVARVLSVQGPRPLRRRQLLVKLSERRHFGPPIVSIEGLPPYRSR